MNTNRIISIAAVLCLVAISGCTTATVIPLEPCIQPVRSCALGTVQLESIFSYSASRRELRSLIVAVGNDHGFSIRERKLETDVSAGEDPSCGGSPEFTINFVLREKNYLRGLKTIHSSAVLAEIHDPAGALIYQVTWINDGTKTLDSMTYLRSALHSVFRSLGHKAFHPRPF